VENHEGKMDETFNGKLYFRIYDSQATLTTRGNSGGTPFSYMDWNKEINNGVDSVKGGKFSVLFIVPKSINYSDENGRIVFYAINETSTEEANGSSEEFLVGGIDDNVTNDTIGPEIFMYLNDREFVDGDAVNANPVFVAELYDESGIQYNGNGIGHELQLCVDGDPKRTYNLNSSYSSVNGNFTRGNVYFSGMEDLAPGAHWLTFRAWDMMNNTSSQSMRFVVGKNLEPEVLSLMLESDIVSGQTNFHVGYDFPGLECIFTLEIFSTAGTVQWKQEIKTSSNNGVVTIPWDGRNGDGAWLNNGIYICRVTASYEGGRKSHKEKKFILKNNK
jgi:hypothetical protein